MLKFSLRGTLCCVAWLEAIESQLPSLYQSLPRLYGRLNHTLQNIIKCVVLMDLSINQINQDTHDPPSEKQKCSHAWCIPSSSKETGLFLCQYICNVFARPKRVAPNGSPLFMTDGYPDFLDGRIFGRTVSKKVLNGFLTDC